MSDQFEKDIFSNINSFRRNPQSIKHQIEVLHRGIGRFKPNDPFLKEIEAFLPTLPSIPKMGQVVINPVLCDIAAKEVKKYVKDEEKYTPYRIGKELEGIVPNELIAEHPALIADNGADEAETIVPKLLLNRLDEQKKGRKILCTKEYTQFGVARTKHQDENYYIIIFANGVPKNDGEVTISVRQKDYVDNYQYYESKFVSNKKPKVLVQHKRHGQIGGSQVGSGEPDIYENQTTMTKKEANDIDNVNKAFEMISPKKNGYISKTFDIRMKRDKEKKEKKDKKERRIEGDGDIFEKKEIKILKTPAEKKVERKKEKIEKKEEIIVETKVEKIIEKKVEKSEDNKDDNKLEGKKKERKLIVEKVEDKKVEEKKVEHEPEPEQEDNKEIGGTSKIKSIRRKFYKSNKK